MSENEVIAPWYRQPWLWFLLAFPLAAITWGLGVLVFASSLDTSMVTDDYSKEGRGINMSIARDQKARDLGVAGSLDMSGRSAELSLETNDGAADFPYLVLNLYHPTHSDQDRVVQFQQRSNGEYVGQIQQELEGRWYYDLQGPTNEWRVKGELRLPTSDNIAIRAEEDTSQG
ncbi:MAG: FixH family protein [Alteromonadaceae bacterium]|nr:FixH family protein [Alteromonadaceae bacterium]